MTDSPFERLVEGLNDPDRMFTRDQVAYLMGTAARWAREAVEEEPSPLSWRAGYQSGYQARIAEENAAYPQSRVEVSGTIRDDARRVHRVRCGVDRPGPRDGDFPGRGDSYVKKLREADVKEGEPLPWQR